VLKLGLMFAETSKYSVKLGLLFAETTSKSLLKLGLLFVAETSKWISILMTVTFESMDEHLTQHNDLASCSRLWCSIFLLLDSFSWASDLLDLMSIASRELVPQHLLPLKGNTQTSQVQELLYQALQCIMEGNAEVGQQGWCVDKAVLFHDRWLHPIKANHPSTGLSYPHWDGSEVQRLLKMDVLNKGNHDWMPPWELHETRLEYQAFCLTFFKSASSNRSSGVAGRCLIEWPGGPRRNIMGASILIGPYDSFPATRWEVYATSSLLPYQFYGD
jgi:hypothetical protein